MPFNRRMNGQNTFMNSSVGLTTISAVASGCSSAMVFGASSPSTMCSAVTMANAIATAMLCAVASAIRAGRNANAGWMSRCERRLADPAEAEAGHRDPELGRGDVAVGIGHRPAHRRAPRCPSAISWSMRVLRTVTIANSAATKKPLANTSARQQREPPRGGRRASAP